MPPWLPSVLIAVATTILGIIAYFLKQTYVELLARQDRQEKAHNELRDKFEQFKEQLPYQFVLRDDWIRATMNLESKIDKLHDLMIQQVGQMTQQVGQLAQQVAQLAAQSNQQGGK